MAEQKSMWTPRDLELLTAGIQCINDGLPNASSLDIAKFANMTGLAENSARTAWSNLRKKSLVGKENGAAPKTPASAAKKASAKRKSTGGKKGENGEDVDGDENAENSGETPTKKPRGRPAKAKAMEAAGEEDSETKDDGEVLAATPAKKKAAPRKPAVKKAPETPKTPEAETEADPAAGDEHSEMRNEAEVPDATPVRKKAAPRKSAVKKTKATSKTPKAEAEASPAAGDDDSEIKDDKEAPAAALAKKKAAPRKPAVGKTTEAASRTPGADVEVEAEAAPKNATLTPESALMGSDDTAHENETITVESAKDIVQVDVMDGKTQVTVTENDEIEGSATS